MKYCEDDIKCGEFVIRHSVKKDDVGYLTTISYKIGYAYIDGKQMICLISITDGCCLLYKNKEEVMNKFNKDEKGYRPLQGEELIKLLTYVGDRRT